MTDKELEALEKLANGATPGPWHTYMAEVHQPGECPPEDDSFVASRRRYRHLIAGLHNTIGEFNQERRNAAFIAAARAAIPALINEVRRLRAEVGLDDVEGR